MTERLRFPLAEGPRLRAELRGHLAGRWGRLAVAIVTLVVGAAVSFLGPWATGSLVDVVSGTLPRSSLTPLVVTVLVAPLVGLVLTRYGGYLAAVVVEGVVSDIRTRAVDRLLRLPLEVVRRRGAGDAVSRASDDVSTLATGVREIVPAIGGVFVTIGITLVGLFAVQWQLGLALLLIVPVELWAIRAFLRDAPPVYLAERAATGERGEAVLSSLQGLPSVRAFRLERQRHELIAEHSWAVARLSVKQRIVNNVLWGRMNLAELVGMSALLVMGFFLVRAGTTSVGSVTVALLAFHRLFGPIGQLLNLVDTWQSASASLRRVVGILSLDAERHGTEAVTRRDETSLRIEHVRCSYDDGPPAVDDVTLEVPAGRTLAVVGASGAGKTTLARVVAGTIAPDSGRVLLDGVDAAELPATERARSMALVAQDLHLFDGSVRDQLTLADADAGDDELWDALRRTGAHEWVERLPDRLDEVVGSLGLALTSQQVQHLALARVLLMDPPVVLLDEATAEAGSQGAASLDRAAEAVVAGRTAVVIAHRLDQAQQADRIAVMERGAVVEEGTHVELVERGGVYARLWQAWSSAPVT